MLWVIFAANAAMSPEAVECMPEKPAGDPGTELRYKKWGIVARRMASPLSNDDYCLLQVDIREIERKSFAHS
jgi:hypothetical protein